MNASRTTTPHVANLSPTGADKPGFRTKTIATRLTPRELTEVESAAERAGKPLSEWLREMALAAAHGYEANPSELVLAEIWAVRHILLSLFHAGAQATVEGKPLLPESVIKIRDCADARKLEQARQMLADFFGQEIEDGGDEQ